VFADHRTTETDAQWDAQQKIRASVGIGISWVSPLGPLRIAYAIPVKQQKEIPDPNNPFVPLVSKDRIQRVQFQIGTAF
jgi:outer membrane protein insertion porin family